MSAAPACVASKSFWFASRLNVVASTLPPASSRPWCSACLALTCGGTANRRATCVLGDGVVRRRVVEASDGDALHRFAIGRRFRRAVAAFHQATAGDSTGS